MRLILSRKGFDASAGGSPSPILPDGTMCSLPIPDPLSPLCYADVEGACGSLGKTVEELTLGRVDARVSAHLDPDLDRGALPRARDWRPLFGQAGSAQGHLARHGVGPGDVFLFFGWFRSCVRESGRLRYAQGAPDLHALFGWLQVAQVVRVAAVRPGDLLWARGHPHFWGERGAGNTLYLAADHLSAGGTSAGARRLPGAGIFRRFEPCVCLTAQPGSVPRSVWKLPEWMHRPRQSPLLSHHGDARRWQPAGEAWLLRTVPRGQEFVIDLDRIHSPERAIAWLRELIGRAFRSS